MPLRPLAEKQRVEVGDSSSPDSVFESKEDSGVEENRPPFPQIPQFFFLPDDTMNLIEDEEDNDLNEFADGDLDKVDGVLGDMELNFFFRRRSLARNGPKKLDFRDFGEVGDLGLREGGGVRVRLS